MSWNAGLYRKGNYASNGWTGDAANSIGIEAGRHDTQDDDFANGINDCLNKNGQNSMNANLNFGTYIPTNIGAGSAAAPAVCVGNDVNTGIFSPAADNWAVATNGTERVRIDSTGNVGIGVASPLARTHISGQVANAIGTGTDQGQLFLSDSDFNTSGLSLGYYYEGGINEYARIQSRSAGGATNLVLQGGNGAVVINKISTSTSIAGTHFTNGASSTSPSTMFMVKTFSGTANGIANYHSGTYVGGVDFSNTATAFPTSSDYRLKENVVKLQNALSRVNQLKPSRFNFISEPDETIDGFLAHEVANVVPNAVFGEKDAVHDDGSIKVQSLDNSKIVPLLTAAIQELNAKVEALEAQLEAITQV